MNTALKFSDDNEEQQLVVIEISKDGFLDSWVALDKEHFVEEVQKRFACASNLKAAKTALVANMRNVHVMTVKQAYKFIGFDDGVHTEAKKMARDTLKCFEL